MSLIFADSKVLLVAARALSDRTAALCNVDKDDQWKLYCDDFIGDAEAVLTAACNNGAPDDWTKAQREELEQMSDASLAAAFRDIAGRNYSTCYASLFKAHVIEAARLKDRQ